MCRPFPEPDASGLSLTYVLGQFWLPRRGAWLDPCVPEGQVYVFLQSKLQSCTQIQSSNPSC